MAERYIYCDVNLNTVYSAIPITYLRICTIHARPHHLLLLHHLWVHATSIRSEVVIVSVNIFNLIEVKVVLKL